jgi:hypothetical protein
MLFAAWGAALLYAGLRPVRRAWRDGFATAGALLLLVPALNAATTQRHLAASWATSDWVFAGFDLTACAFGAAFLFIAWRLRGRAAEVTSERDVAATRRQLEVV